MSTTRVFERDAPAYTESATGHIAKYPSNAWLRWGLRLLAAMPFIALAIAYETASAGDWSATANGALAERVSHLPWGTPDVAAMGELYPPISNLLAVIIPGGAFGLGIAGSLVAGLLIQLVIQSMQRKHFPRGVRVIFILTLAITPIFAYIATTNFESIVGLTFFGIGMLDLVRFITYANTQAGFRAGLLFACSAFTDSTGLLAALVAASAGTFIIQSRPGARFANAIVVVFPTIALMGALALLGVVFGVGPLAMIRGNLQWNANLASDFLAYLGTPQGLVFLAPTIVVVITAIVMRFPGVALVGVLLTAMTVIAFIVGLTPPGMAGNSYILLLLLVVAIVPTATTLRHALLTCTTSIVLWGIGWVSSFQRDVIAAWIATVTGGGPL
ncbi:MAG TPA: hypothetical protein VNT50_06780 [Microbacterium sp.]|uniref:hypothetical protein n=1 Tax=Microbacterium sp. TaxID=51671 RepID=UPI002BDAC9DA|nr:hypothetical protein [Microbacterium sp.]HWI31176.1 hypothetical protein [Microbacterium sp.]